MDRIILGDNQFFGINHMSEQRAMAQAVRFSDTRAILDVIDAACECGIRAFMFNTHGRVAALCEHFRSDPRRYGDLRFYPSLPYAHKYANAVAEKGMAGALKDWLTTWSSARDAVGMAARGGMAFLKKDPFEIMRVLVDLEMKAFRGLAVEVVFLQNIITDLLLGCGIKEVFVEFADHIREKYNADAGFITLNMPMLVDVLLECGIENPIVCSSINKIGFRMNPSKEACERTIRGKTFRPIAMSVLASGAVSPAEALGYVCGQQEVEAIVFGASTRAHIQETKELIERLS